MHKNTSVSFSIVAVTVGDAFRTLGGSKVAASVFAEEVQLEGIEFDYIYCVIVCVAVVNRARAAC